MVSIRTAPELNVLLIVHTASEEIGTIQQHVDALVSFSRHRVVKVDNLVAHRIDFEAFDVIALHYSLVIASPNFIASRLRDKIARFRGVKVLFIQDEYRWIDATAVAMRDLGIGVVFSLVHPGVVRKVYHHPFLSQVRFEYTLTGFVPDEWVTARVPDYEDRPIDVGYRARKLTAWYGSHTLQKWRIADRFAADAGRYNLKVDISTREEDRIYGRDWTRFVANSKACLGTESGASVLDYTGEIQKKVEAHLARHPNAGFEELRDMYFKAEDGKIMMNVISPRCFEAAALRTLMIMYPGEYGGILEPHRHYVLLNQDHSNMDEVVHTLRTPALAKRVIDQAYKEIACSGRWSFKALGAHFETVVSEEGRMVRVRPVTQRIIRQAKWQSKLARYEQRARYLVAIAGKHMENFLIGLAVSMLPTRAASSVELGLQALRLKAKKILFGA